MGFVELHPDFFAPKSTGLPADHDPPRPQRWAPFSVDRLIELVRAWVENPDGVRLLQGRLRVRAPLEAHDRLARRLARLQAQTDLFNAVFGPTRIDANAVPAIIQLSTDMLQAIDVVPRILRA